MASLRHSAKIIYQTNRKKRRRRRSGGKKKAKKQKKKKKEIYKEKRKKEAAEGNKKKVEVGREDENMIHKNISRKIAWTYTTPQPVWSQITQ